MNYSLQQNGILTPDVPVVHRAEEYDPEGFSLLQDMQRRHFWYLGRHRFLLRALTDGLKFEGRPPADLSGIDLGGGCGGWICYLHERAPALFSELALSDSSIHGLELAEPIIPKHVSRYQADVLNLGWVDRWDVVFLLDVLEHIPNDARALQQIAQALKPGGLLLVTTPALPAFWSYNDDLAHHVRRYTKEDFRGLADISGLTLLRSHYFMFFLSPLLWLTRLRQPELNSMNDQQRHEFLARTHRVPSRPVNNLLRFVFDLETPLGHTLPFPWGTSILAVFKKESTPPITNI